MAANLTKQLLEEELGYGAVELQELELDLVFQGVGDCELDTFQDVWLPNHQAQLEEVEGDVVLLTSWYQGETEFGIAVPTYMQDVNAIPDLNDTSITQILGIEPGAVIMEQIPEETVPTYNLRQELAESSTLGMPSEVDNLYGNQEEFAFVVTEQQVNEIEAINPNDYAVAVSTWLEDENNREAVQPWIDAAEDARG